ncbi:hypothetical protein SCLCIDRAFT_26481 [Scleroderma citrinum Foug A]|uniref:Uncharacterized protein n=1 Tax=Scleroderma citrinum Foug A TaxID=1036808 RepID=A0A0C3DIV9_9AGAM|nr:hypothetical protein SCLCIDRAFT_26481 [Scleroderma citrinum Foug A]
MDVSALAHVFHGVPAAHSKSFTESAHQHAANAEDYRNDGLLIKAAEEHSRAAKAFLECEEKANDSNTKRTLHLLYNEHVKAGKELDRRVAKLREEGKDPSLPQKPLPRITPVHSNRPTANPSGVPHTTHLVHGPTPNPSSSVRLSDSQNNVDESFMVLGQRSDPGDAFNNFWKIMEGMLDNLSQPVAFTTAPLGMETDGQGKRGLRRDGSSSSDTDREDSLGTKLSRKLGLDSMSKQEILFEETEEEVLVDEGDDLSESFYLIPTGPETPLSTLKRENTFLRREVDETQKRLALAERVLQLRKEQDQQLRDSIVLARQQAQRAMGASLMIQRPGGQSPQVDLSGFNINVPAVPAPVTALNAGRDREAQHLRRIRELEEELRTVRMDNDKQKIMIARFRERWEKLKESAKRKKDAKAAEAAKMGVGERIEEEPEAEAEHDDVHQRR